MTQKGIIQIVLKLSTNCHVSSVSNFVMCYEDGGGAFESSDCCITNQEELQNIAQQYIFILIL